MIRNDSHYAHLPASAPQDASIETKDDFGLLVRRIMWSNSGQFWALGADGRPIKEHPVPQPENPHWSRYRDQAEAAAKNGNYSQAESMWLHALSEAKNFDQRDCRLASTLDNLASLYFSTGRYEQAEMFCTKALEAARLIYGTSHIRYGNCLNNLAGILYNQGRYHDAEPLCMQVLAIYEGVYGPDHADVGMVCNNLAMIYHTTHRFEHARRMYERAFRIRSRAYGGSHPIVRTLKENYRNLLIAMQQSSDQKVFAPNRRTMENAFGPEMRQAV